MTGIIIDAIVIILLIMTITFCWRLNNKIIELRGSKNDLLDLIKTFDSAILKTNKSITELKVMSTNSTHELQTYLAKASELIGDLSFMTDTASTLADRIEKGMSEMRKTKNTSPTGLNEHLDKIVNNLTSSEDTPTINNERVSFGKTRDDLFKAIKSVGKA